jgi:flagellar biosynthesis/type III secretory pathway chaperone
MNQNLQQEIIESVLHEELEGTIKLLELLQLEHTALIANDSDQIETAIAAKQDVIDHLGNLGQRRNSLCENAGFNTDKAGMNGYIVHCSSKYGQHLGQYWQRIMVLAESCRRQNDINGRIINTCYRNAKSALAILRGQTPGSEQAYGPKGSDTPSPPPKTIARA